MRQVAHIHIPRVAGRSIDKWARRLKRKRKCTYQQLYKANGVGRYVVGGKWTPEFDPTVDWTYVGHSYAGDLLEGGVITEEWWDRVFKFTFIRNTYQRLVSVFEFERTRRFRRTRGHWSNIKLLHFSDFIDHIVSGGDSRRRPSGAKMWPYMNCRQLAWLDRGIDFVGRMDNMEEDWERLCEQIGVQHKSLPHRNKVVEHLDMRNKMREGWRSYYTPELVDKVTDYFRDEIDFGGFRFE